MRSPTAQTTARVRAPVPESVDVAIVGCGLGGLMTGALLARSGLRVACFDHHYVAGGCATMFERGRSESRYRFDVGLHYVGDCGPDGQVPGLLRQAGVDVQWHAMDPGGFDTLVYPGLTFRIPADKDLYRQRLLALFPSERAGIDRYLRFLAEVDHVGRRVEAQAGRMSWRTLVDVLLRGRLLARYQEATIQQVMDDCTRDRRLQAVWLGQSGDYGVRPSQASAVLHAGLANHYFRGAYYPKGGGQVLADGLADQIEAHGGGVHLRCGIAHIVVEDGRAVGVRTEPHRGPGQEVRARAVVSNADLKRTLLELIGPHHLPSGWAVRAKDMQMGGALYLLCLGLRGGLPEPVFGPSEGATNYWQFDDFDIERFYTQGEAEPRPRGCYLTSASIKDPDTVGHAPAGEAAVEVMTLVPGRPNAWGVTPGDLATDAYRKAPAYQAHKTAVEEALLDRMEAMFPGVRDRVTFREGATPLTHTRYTRASDGTGYGLAATPSQFLRHRPGYRGPLSGLYFAGASTRAGHGIVGALSSGLRCAERLAADLGTKLAPPPRP